MRLDFVETKKNEHSKVICPRNGKMVSDKYCPSCRYFGMFREEYKGIVCRWSQQREVLEKGGIV